jgi:hypothetical protein
MNGNAAWSDGMAAVLSTQFFSTADAIDWMPISLAILSLIFSTWPRWPVS